MQQPAIHPKISLTINVKQVQDLVKSLPKDAANQQLHIDIYVAPAPTPASPPIHEGPHEVNRGSWALVPPAAGGPRRRRHLSKNIMRVASTARATLAVGAAAARYTMFAAWVGSRRAAKVLA